MLGKIHREPKARTTGFTGENRPAGLSGEGRPATRAEVDRPLEGRTGRAGAPRGTRRWVASCMAHIGTRAEAALGRGLPHPPPTSRGKGGSVRCEIKRKHRTHPYGRGRWGAGLTQPPHVVEQQRSTVKAQMLVFLALPPPRPPPSFLPHPHLISQPTPFP